MASRSQRAIIAQETVAITQTGEYIAPSGAKVFIRDKIQSAIRNTTLITPEAARSLRSKAQPIASGRSFDTRFEVINETTFSAASRLVKQFGSNRVAALNFASAKNPGGGFLNGSQAQEESLARGSALYACLLTQNHYYEANRHERSLLYTDHMIIAPEVPVFRNDNDELLSQPWEVTIITSPAPNAGAIEDSQPNELAQLEPTFQRRIEQVLSAAVIHEQTALVLGAWGCGVFRNDPNMVARLFGSFLLNDGAYSKAFEQVTFAVLDRQGDTLAAFASIFR